MLLREWMKKNDIRGYEVARMLGIGEMHVSNIIRGSAYPSRKLAIAIERITCSEVSRYEAIFPGGKEEYEIQQLSDKFENPAKYVGSDGSITDRNAYIKAATLRERGISNTLDY